MAERSMGWILSLVATRRNGHRFIAEQCAPHLRDGQVIVLNPGITCGAIEFYCVLHEAGVKAGCDRGRGTDLHHASRMLNPAQVRIQRVKNSIPVAAIPATRTADIVKLLNRAYPQFVMGSNGDQHQL